MRISDWSSDVCSSDLAGLRPTDVVYDRTGSAFAETPAEAWDWDALLEGVTRLHLSGITPALGPVPAASALAAARAAAKRNIPISFDGNYRARLWEAWDSDPRSILTELVGYADILRSEEHTTELQSLMR